jgi:surfeit locus 1 family protein
VKKRDASFAVLGLAVAVTCISLGFWQLRRLEERREFNRQLRARAETAPVDLSAIPKDTGEARFRRVRLIGSYDFANEVRLTNRVRNGSPGVNIITPLRLPGTDTAVLVNRGWVYAPDAMTVDFGRWREPTELRAEGYIENYAAGRGNARTASNAKAFRWMDRLTLAQAFPYPIAPYFAVLIGDSGKTSLKVPPRLDVPPLDEGPHKSYAFQWFSFAAISIFGTLLYLRRK